MDLYLKNAYRKLAENKLDGLILSSSANISYLTGFRSRDSYFILSSKQNIYITDSRYTQEARANLKGCLIKESRGSVFSFIAMSCRKLGLKHVGFEERILSFAEYQKIKEGLGGSINLIPTYGIIEGLRLKKHREELIKIRKAVQINIASFKFIQGFIRPGLTELEVAGEMERFIRKNGAYSSGFEIIVAAGPNSCFPHHTSSARRIRNNEPVLIDAGADYLGYKSDLTRVFFLGKITSLFRRVYDIVQEAQSRAIKKIRPGIPISEIDAASRGFIARKGYGNFFGHNLGHGIGREIHEEPHISKNDDARLEAGMVFTVEPGIYLARKFGVRLEDMVLVTRKKAEVLSGALHK